MAFTQVALRSDCTGKAIARGSSALAAKRLPAIRRRSLRRGGRPIGAGCRAAKRRYSRGRFFEGQGLRWVVLPGLLLGREARWDEKQRIAVGAAGGLETGSDLSGTLWKAPGRRPAEAVGGPCAQGRGR